MQKFNTGIHEVDCILPFSIPLFSPFKIQKMINDVEIYQNHSNYLSKLNDYNDDIGNNSRRKLFRSKISSLTRNLKYSQENTNKINLKIHHRKGLAINTKKHRIVNNLINFINNKVSQKKFLRINKCFQIPKLANVHKDLSNKELNKSALSGSKTNVFSENILIPDNTGIAKIKKRLIYHNENHPRSKIFHTTKAANDTTVNSLNSSSLIKKSNDDYSGHNLLITKLDEIEGEQLKRLKFLKKLIKLKKLNKFESNKNYKIFQNSNYLPRETSLKKPKAISSRIDSLVKIKKNYCALKKQSNEIFRFIKSSLSNQND